MLYVKTGIPGLTRAQPIVFSNLKNVEIAMEGNLSLPADVATVQGVVGASVRLLLSKRPNLMSCRASLDIGSRSQVWF